MNKVLFVLTISIMVLTSCKKEKNCAENPYQLNPSQYISAYYINSHILKYLHNQSDTVYAVKTDSIDAYHVMDFCGNSCIYGGGCNDKYKVKRQYVGYTDLLTNRLIFYIDYDYHLEYGSDLAPYSIYYFDTYLFTSDKNNDFNEVGTLVSYDSLVVNNKVYKDVRGIYCDQSIDGNRQLYFSSDGKVIKFVHADTHEMYELIE